MAGMWVNAEMPLIIAAARASVAINVASASLVPTEHSLRIPSLVVLIVLTESITS